MLACGVKPRSPVCCRHTARRSQPSKLMSRPTTLKEHRAVRRQRARAAAERHAKASLKPPQRSQRYKTSSAPRPAFGYPVFLISGRVDLSLTMDALNVLLRREGPCWQCDVLG